MTLFCCLAVAFGGVYQLGQRLEQTTTVIAAGLTVTPTLNLPQPTPTPFPTPRKAVPTPIPTPTADEHIGQASPIQLSTEQLLLAADLPERDQRLLAMRLKHGGKDIPEVVKTTPTLRQVGDTDTFWITDNGSTPPRQLQASATLKYLTDHSYWWVEDGYNVSQADLERSANQFENQTYPTNRAFFGSEWSPGVDGDPHVHILMGDVPGVAGYYSASNEFSQLVEPYSNEREMFYINLDSLPPGNTYFDSVLAHEFQHMIHWRQDRNESTWVNEGMSELAPFINGYGPSSFSGIYALTPDTQLTGWADTPGDAAANYGGSFLMMAYFLQRFGEDMTQAVVANPANGMAGFTAVLSEHGYTEQFNDIFADFLVANYVNDPSLAEGRWGYRDFSPQPAAITQYYEVYPAQEQATVNQYGADYIELRGAGDVTLNFRGDTEVNVVDNQPHSGRYQWYSNRGDDSNSHLTRAFDLTGVTSATLNYSTWYDIEPDWDYAYVEVSTDGGQTWTVLTTPHSATTNPSGNAYGPGYTGLSGGGPHWLEESLDLTPYAGQKIRLRFEYVTDDAVNRPGWTLDDLSIPEIDFYDAAENGDNDWQAEGFVRMDNILRQHILAQVIEIGDTVRVRPIPLDESNHGSLTVKGLGDTLERAVLVVSGLAPVTSQPAHYEYQLSQ